MKDTLLNPLLKFGLSDKEATVYVALLELEVATAFEVAKYSNVNRSSAYVVLETLRKKGFVGTSEDKRVRRYVPSSPETLLYSAKTIAKEQAQIISGIESIIPNLRALHKSTKRRPIVKVFEGQDGAKEVYWDLFSTKAKEIRTYTNPVNIFEQIPDFYKEHDKERGKRGIKMYMINPISENLAKLPTPNKPYEVALIPESKYKFTSDMAIYANRIALASPKDNFGIIIESQEIAEMIKISFDLAWAEAKRLEKKIIKK